MPRILLPRKVVRPRMWRRACGLPPPASRLQWSSAAPKIAPTSPRIYVGRGAAPAKLLVGCSQYAHACGPAKAVSSRWRTTSSFWAQDDTSLLAAANG